MSWIFVALLPAALVCALNLSGVFVTIVRRWRGERRSYSSVPLFSLLFGLGAWVIVGDALFPWVLVPVVLDPGTWMLVIGLGMEVHARLRGR